MLVTADVTFTTGGYPSPTYEGKHRVSVNAEEYSSDEEINSLLVFKALSNITSNLSIRTTKIKITIINIVED